MSLPFEFRAKILHFYFCWKIILFQRPKLFPIFIFNFIPTSRQQLFQEISRKPKDKNTLALGAAILFIFSHLWKIPTEPRVYSALPHIPLKAHRNAMPVQITACVLFVYFFKKAYVAGTRLKCIDLSMQFKWVLTTYAFIKKIRKPIQKRALWVFFYLFRRLSESYKIA